MFENQSMGGGGTYVIWEVQIVNLEIKVIWLVLNPEYKNLEKWN